MNGTAALDVEDLGNAESLLSNRRYFTAIARKLLNGGIMPNKGGWGGWLGRYQAVLAKAATETSRREQNTLTVKANAKDDESAQSEGEEVFRFSRRTQRMSKLGLFYSILGRHR